MAKDSALSLEELREKYRLEREKRLRTDGNAQYKEPVGDLEAFDHDSYADPNFTRDPLVEETERYVLESPNRERSTEEIGALLMARLKKLDKVAYVRFASVYLDFKDVKEFMGELKGLLREKERARK